MAVNTNFITVYVCDPCWWEGLPEVDEKRFPFCPNCGSYQLRREQREVDDNG